MLIHFYLLKSTGSLIFIFNVLDGLLGRREKGLTAPLSVPLEADSEPIQTKTPSDWRELMIYIKE